MSIIPPDELTRILSGLEGGQQIRVVRNSDGTLTCEHEQARIDEPPQTSRIRPFVNVVHTTYFENRHAYDKWVRTVLRERTIPSVDAYLARNPQSRSSLVLGEIIIPGEPDLRLTYRPFGKPLVQDNPYRDPATRHSSLAANLRGYVADESKWAGITFYCEISAFSSIVHNEEPLPDTAWIPLLKFFGRLKFPLLYELTKQNTVRFLNIHHRSRAMHRGIHIPEYLSYTIGNDSYLVDDETRTLLEIRDAEFVRKFRDMSRSYERQHTDTVHAMFGQIYKHELDTPFMAPELREKVAYFAGGPSKVFQQMTESI